MNRVTEKPFLRLIDNTVLVREEIIAPGAAVRVSELWETEIASPAAVDGEPALVEWSATVSSGREVCNTAQTSSSLSGMLRGRGRV